MSTMRVPGTSERIKYRNWWIRFHSCLRISDGTCIGHLQRNKVKYIVDKVYLIHSVDSLRLAEEISREAVKKQVEVNILIEVNVAQEESKFGTTTEETEKLVRDISFLPSVHIKGLMTIAPFVEDPEENRTYFRKLRQLAVDIWK